MLSKGVAFCIGEFGDFQNGGDVDEATIMQYCTEKGIGYAAWSWKGNGGSDATLDLSGDWKAIILPPGKIRILRKRNRDQGYGKAGILKHNGRNRVGGGD